MIIILTYLRYMYIDILQQDTQQRIDSGAIEIPWEKHSQPNTKIK